MSSVKTSQQKAEFALKLAEFHANNTSDEFGWREDNYLNAFCQDNTARFVKIRTKLTLRCDWIDFFRHNRLEPIQKALQEITKDSVAPLSLSLQRRFTCVVSAPQHLGWVQL